ncbi:hypothetical protein KP509_18G001300 [Ceratopteris richardii]|uniref:Uncharacterized protein n=1 Tax=Ceratopteris richardii TaxID=49495 RepID=A0A8T2SM65_CERRI|nr:hypothetical protein KP509_18G001300 [Ceratopteris richardii]
MGVMLVPWMLCSSIVVKRLGRVDLKDQTYKKLMHLGNPSYPLISRVICLTTFGVLKLGIIGQGPKYYHYNSQPIILGVSIWKISLVFSSSYSVHESRYENRKVFSKMG